VTVKNEDKYSNLLFKKDENLLLLISPKHNQTIKKKSDIFRQKFVHLVHGDEASPFNINNVTQPKPKKPQKCIGSYKGHKIISHNEQFEIFHQLQISSFKTFQNIHLIYSFRARS
jgi:hypothetical protein